MVVKDVDKTNIWSIIYNIESAIEKTCSDFSYRSIVERVLVDVCVSHYNYLSLKTNFALLNIGQEDKLNPEFFLSSLMQTPHYITCFSTIKSICRKPISETEYRKLRKIVGLWLFLTEIPYTGLLNYFESLRIDPRTFEAKARFNAEKFLLATSTFKDFLDEYSTYEATRPQSSLPRIFSLALEDICRVDNLILHEKGFRPSSVLRALYALAEEWGEIFKVPETYITIHRSKSVAQEFCDVLMDLPLEYCQKILRRTGFDGGLETFDKITLTPTIAKKYIHSRKTRKRDRDIFMHSYPLWDYPLLKIDQNYVSHPVLLVQCLQELAYKFIASSESALAHYAQDQHEKLIQKTLSILKEEAFSDIRPNIRITEKKRDIAQFDIIAIKKPYLLHIECKTKRMPWRMRMFLNPKEMRKEGLDFVRENKLSIERWNKKIKSLRQNAKTVLDDSQYKLISLVVTDTPTPASITCKHIDIVWIARLKEYIHKTLKKGK